MVIPLAPPEASGLADAGTLPAVTGLIGVVELALLATVVGIVALAGRRALAQRLLALALAALLAQNAVAFLAGLGVLDRGFYLHRGALLVAAGAAVAFAWHFPAPPAPRSWTRAALLLAGAHVALGAALWWGARHALYPDWPAALAPQTVWVRLFIYEGLVAQQVLLAATIVARGRDLPGGAARGIVAIACAAALGAFSLGAAGAEAVLDATGLVPGAFFLPAFYATLAGPTGLPLVLLAAGMLGAVALAAWCAQQGWWVPAVVLGASALFNALRFPTGFPLNLHFVALAAPVLVLHALGRHGAFGVALPPRAWTALAALQGATVFLVVAGLVAVGTGDAFAQSVAVLAGLGLGALAAWAVLPAGHALLGAAASPSADRLAAYRRALEAEAEAGAPAAAAAAKLRGLRAELGLSDRDHAVLDHAVRAARDGGPVKVTLEPGATVLGRYRIERLLGEGSAGRTFLAQDTAVNRKVVLKALRADASEDPSVLREARALAALQHPHVVTLYDVERVGDQVFIVMEHLAGGSLAARLSRGPLPAQAFRQVGLGVLDALAAIHGAGLVHRDVKPSNILLTAAGEPKVADFGIAQLPGAEATIAGARGAPLGTLRFMSPEQARGMRATPRSDLYSAGAALYEALTGQPWLEPRAGETAADLQLRAAFPPGKRGPAGVPAALRPWFAKALHPEPEKRFASAAAMRVALERALAAR